MKTFDAIIVGLTVGLARLLRVFLKTYNRLKALVNPETTNPFGKCDKVIQLRNNKSVSEESSEWRSLPITNQEQPQRRIIQ